MKYHKFIISVWLMIFTFCTVNCFAQISDADNSFLVNLKTEKTPQKMEKTKEAKEAREEKSIFVDPIPRVDVVKLYKEVHPNTISFDTQKETNEFEKNLQRNSKEFEASLQKEQELTKEVHRQNERQKEYLKHLEQHRTGLIFSLIGKAFNAVIGFFTLVIFITFFVFLIKSIVKQHRRYKEQMINRKFDFNPNCNKYDTYNANQPQSSAYKSGSEDYEASHRRDESGCYGINPATGLPLRSPGIDVAGNPLGPSNFSSYNDMFSQNTTITHNSDTNL